MSLSQQPMIVPPTTQDLTDFASIIQRTFSTLFQAAHYHVGSQGILTSAPTTNQGAVGDILIGIVAGSAYIYFKTDSTTWYRLGPATKV